MITLHDTAIEQAINNGSTRPPITGEVVAGQVEDVKSKPVSTVPSSSGWRPPTPFSHRGYTLKEMRLEGESSGLDSSGRRNGFIYNGPASNRWYSSDLDRYATVPDWVSDQAVNRALANLSGNVNVAEDFAEHKQTAKLAGDTVHRIAEGVRSFRKDHPSVWQQVKGQSGRRFASIPKLWLEHQYGWVPLLLDVKESFDLLKRLDSDGDAVRLTVKGSAKYDRRVTGFTGFNRVNLLDDVAIVSKKSMVRHDRTGAFCRLDYRVVNPVLHTMQQLGLLNPVDLVWELQPLSFVVDWFLPIGSYLQSWTGTFGLSFLGGSLSKMARRDDTWDSAKAIVENSSPFPAQPGSLSSFDIERDVFSSSPMPRLPSWKSGLSLTHLANGLSLLSVLLS